MSELIDNKAHRVRTLKEIIRHLHAGQPADQVRDRLKEIVRETDYSEIVAMEEQLLAEGMPASARSAPASCEATVSPLMLSACPALSQPRQAMTGT